MERCTLGFADGDVGGESIPAREETSASHMKWQPTARTRASTSSVFSESTDIQPSQTVFPIRLQPFGSTVPKRRKSERGLMRSAFVSVALPIDYVALVLGQSPHRVHIQGLLDLYLAPSVLSHPDHSGASSLQLRLVCAIAQECFVRPLCF